MYETPVRESLSHLSANRTMLTDVQAVLAAQGGTGGHDELALGRISRSRRETLERVTRDRDYRRFQAEMERLDEEEHEARSTVRAAVSVAEVVEYLDDLPALYDAAEPQTQKRIFQALFKRIEVLGPSRIWLYPSAEAEARGLGPLFAGEFRTKLCRSGRGERDSPSETHRTVPFLLIKRTPPRQAAEQTA